MTRGGELLGKPMLLGAPEVPTQIFEAFLEALAGSDISKELIARLRKCLLEDKRFTEQVLKAALFGEEPRQ